MQEIDVIAGGQVLIDNFHQWISRVRQQHSKPTGRSNTEEEWDVNMSVHMAKIKKSVEIFCKAFKGLHRALQVDHALCHCSSCHEERKISPDLDAEKLPVDLQGYIEKRKESKCLKPATRVLQRLTRDLIRSLIDCVNKGDRVWQCYRQNNRKELGLKIERDRHRS
jgi:hypothetical protein